MKIYLHLSLSLLLLLALCPLPIYAQPGNWSDPVNISNNSGGSSDPDMAVGTDGSIHVVWEDYTNSGSPYFRDILYASFDGLSWTPPEIVCSAIDTSSTDPSIALDSDNYPHIVWNYNSLSPYNDIYYVKKTESGWSTPENLTLNLGTSRKPEIAIDHQGEIHAFWVSYFSGLYKMIHRVKENDEWFPYEIISDDTLSYNEIKIEIDGVDRIHLSCKADLGGNTFDIFYVLHEGGIWGEPENISNSDSTISQEPDIALDTNNNPHIVWREKYSNDFSEIYYTAFSENIWEPFPDIFQGSASLPI